MERAGTSILDSDILPSDREMKFLDFDQLDSPQNYENMFARYDMPYIQSARETYPSFNLYSSAAFDGTNSEGTIPEVPEPDDHIRTFQDHFYETDPALYRTDDELSQILSEDIPRPREEYKQSRAMRSFHRNSPSFESVGVQCCPEESVNHNLYDIGVWNRLNDMFVERGFEAIPILQDEFCIAYPDMDKLSGNLKNILDELDKTEEKLRSKIRDNGVIDRLRQEIEKYRQENDSIGKINEKLRHELNNERNKESEQVKNAENHIREMEKHTRALKQKLENSTQICREKENQILELKNQIEIKPPELTNMLRTIGSEKEKAIFRKFLSKEFNPQSGQDCKTMAMIIAYEEQKKNLIAELERRKDINGSFTLNTSFQQVIVDLQKQLGETITDLERISKEKSDLKSISHKYQEEISNLKQDLHDRPTTKERDNLREMVKKYESTLQNLHENSISQPDSDSRRLLSQISEIFNIRNPSSLLPSIMKMQQVVRAIPQLEKFIQAVCQEIFPENEYEQSPDILDKVIPTLRKWKLQLEDYKDLQDFKSSLLRSLRMDNKPEINNSNLVSVNSAGACFKLSRIKSSASYCILQEPFRVIKRFRNCAYYETSIFICA